MSLRVEIKPDMTGQNTVLVIGNCRKILASNELSVMKKIAHGNSIDQGAKLLFNYFRKERMDVIKEADLDKPKRKKLICEAIVKILKQYY
jgi:hypothetical protein